MKLLAPLPVDADQIGRLQDGEVLGHRLARHRHVRRERAQRLAASGNKRSSSRRRLGSARARKTFSMAAYMQLNSCISTPPLALVPAGSEVLDDGAPSESVMR